jgi:hypothetical protein
MDPSVTGPRLETERLLLRWFTLDDLDVFNELGTNPQIIRYIGNQPFASLEVAKETLTAAPLKRRDEARVFVRPNNRRGWHP